MRWIIGSFCVVFTIASVVGHPIAGLIVAMLASAVTGLIFILVSESRLAPHR